MKVKRILKKIVLKYLKKKEYKNRNKYWHNAFKKNIKSQSVLTHEEKKKVKEYYGKYTKNIDLVYHEFYKQKTGNFDVNFIPDSLYYNYVDHFYNDWKLALKFDNKCLYDLYFANYNKPVTLFYRMNNFWFDENKKIITYKELLSIIKNYKNIFIKKATESEGGHGVFFIKEVNNKEVINLLKKIEGDIVIQKEIEQSKTLSKLNPSSVNTVRVLTLLRNNEINVLSTVIRIGNKGSKVDNASSGGLTCGINENGKLKNIAYTSSGEKYSKHPYTNIAFSSIVIPNYNRIIDMAKTLATSMPYFRLVSWDIALDKDDNPLLIEANLRYGELDFHQLNNGPIFGNKTSEILNEVFDAYK